MEIEGSLIRGYAEIGRELHKKAKRDRQSAALMQETHIYSELLCPRARPLHQTCKMGQSKSECLVCWSCGVHSCLVYCSTSASDMRLVRRPGFTEEEDDARRQSTTEHIWTPFLLCHGARVEDHLTDMVAIVPAVARRKKGGVRHYSSRHLIFALCAQARSF